MNVCSLVGTRPQFLKLAALDHYIQAHNPFNHFIVHSGQHFDSNMSDIFFKQLNISKPNLTIHRNTKSNISNLSTIMSTLEGFIIENSIDCVIVYGDCDTTLAEAIVANKLGITLVHIEAGMRSYNKNMPEENNRVLTDHLSDILLCPDSRSLENLNKENIHNNIKVVGNLQVELINNILKKIGNNKPFSNYGLLTIHRDYNTNEIFLKKIFEDLSNINKPFLFPVHPRTRNIIKSNDIKIPENVYLNDPYDYIEMLSMLNGCDFVVTDSGGLQLESWYLDKKCIVMRSETEWKEPIKSGNSILYDRQTNLDQFIQSFLQTETKYKYNLPVNTSELICESII